MDDKIDKIDYSRKFTMEGIWLKLCHNNSSVGIFFKSVNVRHQPKITTSLFNLP